MIATTPPCPNGLPASRAASAVKLAAPAWPAAVPVSHEVGVLVTVFVDASGHVTRAVVSGYRPSSNNAGMQRVYEDAALAAAKASTYEPAIAHCVPVPGKYVVEISNISGGWGSCAEPVRAATATQVAAPRRTHSANGSTTVDVVIDIDEYGNVTDARPMNADVPKELADAAIDAAKRSKFTPKVVGCRPVPGSYIFRVTM